MRIVRREAERLVDSRLELLGDRVLEPIGFGVHVDDVQWAVMETSGAISFIKKQDS